MRELHFSQCYYKGATFPISSIESMENIIKYIDSYNYKKEKIECLQKHKHGHVFDDHNYMCLCGIEKSLYYYKYYDGEELCPNFRSNLKI